MTKFDSFKISNICVTSSGTSFRKKKFTCMKKYVHKIFYLYSSKDFRPGIKNASNLLIYDLAYWKLISMSPCVLEPISGLLSSAVLVFDVRYCSVFYGP